MNGLPFIYLFVFIYFFFAKQKGMNEEALAVKTDERYMFVYLFFSPSGVC